MTEAYDLLRGKGGVCRKVIAQGDCNITIGNDAQVDLDVGYLVTRLQMRGAYAYSNLQTITVLKTLYKNGGVRVYMAMGHFGIFIGKTRYTAHIFMGCLRHF